MREAMLLTLRCKQSAFERFATAIRRLLRGILRGLLADCILRQGEEAIKFQCICVSSDDSIVLLSVRRDSPLAVVASRNRRGPRCRPSGEPFPVIVEVGRALLARPASARPAVGIKYGDSAIGIVSDAVIMIDNRTSLHIDTPSARASCSYSEFLRL